MKVKFRRLGDYFRCQNGTQWAPMGALEQWQKQTMPVAGLFCISYAGWCFSKGILVVGSVRVFDFGLRNRCCSIWRYCTDVEWPLGNMNTSHAIKADL